jgi:Zn-dependent peptidase ImmA (M78 family)
MKQKIDPGICNSCKRMRLLKSLKKYYNVSREMQDYMNRYQIIHKSLKKVKEEQIISMF